MSSDRELRRVTELFLERRFPAFDRDLDEARAEVEEEMARQGLPAGTGARGLLSSAWFRALEAHCGETLCDLTGLLRSFGAMASGGWVRVPFDSHVDRVAAEVTRRLTHFGLGAAAIPTSERNRITNLTTQIKRDCAQRLGRDVERARQLQDGPSEPGLSPTDLDDRLPLGRRGAFDQDLVAGVQRGRRSEEPVCLVMMDIDHFKRVNDEHGHPVGDEVLLAVAERLVKCLGRKGKAYRYGGEEFALVLPNYSPEEAVGLAERVRLDIEGAVLSTKSLSITASFGVACVPEHASEAAALLEKSDAALYRAKEQGRNRVCSSED